ncbi:hypothetical protein AOQ84DRAFT_291711, partial [Glonium stellatum]
NVAPALKSVKYNTLIFNGSFYQPSIYRGNPSEELDASWDRITDNPLFPISAMELGKIGKSLNSVKYPPDRGGDYAGGLEVFHQLHCLNILRKYTYAEYYFPREKIFQLAPEMVRAHLDHCIEIIRTNLMCTGDVSLLTYNWVYGLQHPTPNFNTQHKCRDFESIISWSTQNRRDFGPERRMGGEIELDSLP